MYQLDIEQIAEEVKTAPSIFNSQPWSFKVPSDDRIELYVSLSGLDESDGRRWELSPGKDGRYRLDPLAREFAISCGAALYNMRLAIRVAGHDLAVRLPPHPRRDSTLLASVEIMTGRVKAPTMAEQELYEAIWQRRTNRWPYTIMPAPLPIIIAMEYAAFQEGASLRLLQPSQAREWIRLAAEADRYLEAEPEDLAPGVRVRYQRYQEHRNRWRGKENNGVGVPTKTFGPTPTRRSLTRKDFWLADMEQPFEARPQLMALSTDDDRLPDWLRAGQALQRALLTGTRYSMSPPYGLAAKYRAPHRYGIPAQHRRLRRHDDLAYDGLSVSFLTQPLERYDIECGDIRAKPPPRPTPWRFAELPQMVIRVGYAAHPADAAPRRHPDIVDTRPQPQSAPLRLDSQAGT